MAKRMKARGYYVTRKNIGHSIVDMEWEVVNEGEVGEFSPPFILDEEWSKETEVFVPLNEDEYLVANALNACIGTRIPYAWSQVGHAIKAENRERVLALTPDVLRRNSSNAASHRIWNEWHIRKNNRVQNEREEGHWTNRGFGG